MPHQIKCPILPQKTASEVVQITPWYESATATPIQAYECYAKEKKQIRKFGAFRTPIDSFQENYFPISKEDCWKMVTDKTSPYGEQLQRLNDGFFGTKNQIEIGLFRVPVPFTTTTDTAVNFYFLSMKMSVSIDGQETQTTTQLQEKCPPTKGFCKTSLGLLVWKPEHTFTCRLEKGESTKCVKTDNRISCPEIELSITGITTIQLCNMTLGTSEQGIHFTADFSRQFNNKIAFTGHLVATKSRKTRSAKSPNNYRPSTLSFMSSAEINAKFSFIYDLIRQNSSYNNQMFHLSICKMNQRSLAMIKYLAAAGNPTLLVRTLLHEKKYKARLNGDVLSVWLCETVNKFMLLPRTQCILEWPISYILKNDKLRGYISPLSHEIVDTPTKTPCPPPDFYLELGNDVVLLTNKTILTHLPTLPAPGKELDEFSSTFPDLSFKAPGVYSLDDITQQETIMGMLRQMSNRYQVDDVIKASASGLEIQGDLETTLNALQNLIFSPFRTAIANVLLLIFIAAVVFFTFRYCFNRNPQFRHIHLPLV